ncbi:MAG: FkbM family methyltransferase [Chloroflexota bacterium]
MANPILTLAARMARYLPAPLKQGFYKLGPLTKLMRGVLNQATPEGLTTIKIAGGLLAGVTSEIDLKSEKDYWLGTYEIDLQNALSALVRPGMVAYDVGANVGYVSLILGKLVGEEGQVVCLEANPENVKRLEKNLQLNEKLSQFTLIGKAVADKSGAIEFFVHESDDMGKVAGSAGRQENYTEALAIQAVSLDDLVYKDNLPAPHLIKIDIEGGEVLAFPGMQQLLKKTQPLVLVELHGPESAAAAWTTLIAADYTLHLMKAGFPQVDSVEELDWKAYLIGMSLHG